MGDCKKCGHNCHCSNGQCECKDCDCKDRNLKKSIRVLSDLQKKDGKTVVFDPDFSLTEH